MNLLRMDIELDANDPQVTLTFYKRLFPFKQIYTWLNQHHGRLIKLPIVLKISVIVNAWVIRDFQLVHSS